MAEDINKTEYIAHWHETQTTLNKALEAKETLVDIFKISKKDLNIIYQNAYNAFKVEDYHQAENLFLCLLIWDFKDYNYQVGLGAVYEAQEKFEDAMAMYSLAMFSKGKNPEILFRTGKCLLALGEKSEAKIMFELATDYEKKIPEANLGILGSIEKSKNMLQLINT